jgi:hypothetical protein
MCRNVQGENSNDTNQKRINIHSGSRQGLRHHLIRNLQLAHFMWASSLFELFITENAHETTCFVSMPFLFNGMLLVFFALCSFQFGVGTRKGGVP